MKIPLNNFVRLCTPQLSHPRRIDSGHDLLCCRYALLGLEWGSIETKLAAILDQIDSGSVLLPEFQRGYVRNRDQVSGLMRSVYRGYPVGGPTHLEDAG
jgi:hypothetical protein